MITKYSLSLCVLALGLCSPIHAQPNILLIMVDDMGFSDLGSYGGENYLKAFRITYNLNSRILNIGDQWELRARLNDENTRTYSINEEGFGISSVVVYGIPQ
jgi:hypothetical protein